MPLARFNPAQTLQCSKCGAQIQSQVTATRRINYCPGNTEALPERCGCTSLDTADRSAPHLTVSCHGCGFEWSLLPADAPI